MTKSEFTEAVNAALISGFRPEQLTAIVSEEMSRICQAAMEARFRAAVGESQEPPQPRNRAAWNASTDIWYAVRDGSVIEVRDIGDGRLQDASGFDDRLIATTKGARTKFWATAQTGGAFSGTGSPRRRRRRASEM